MKTNVGIKVLFTLMVSCNVLQLPVLFAEENFNECSSEALRAFFPKIYVQKTLKKFNVPQDKWGAITEGLHSKEKEIASQLESKAASMNPNPFKDRSQQKIAVKFVKETILEITTGVFNVNGIRDETQIQAMLDDIQIQKTQQFQECIKKHKLPFMNAKEMPPK